MKRMMVTVGLTLAVWTGVAIADPGRDESGKGWDQVARELRFDRDRARGYEGNRSRHAVRTFKGEYDDGRCKLGRALRHKSIWRGYPQSR